MTTQTTKLATGSATSQLTNQRGRTILTARGNHLVVDSPSALAGPNEALNPIDLLLGALATCATFICESAAQELGIPLDDVTVTVAGDFDARGLCDRNIDPHVQAFRVRIALKGPTEAQAEALVAEFRGRCPVYTTLTKSAPTEIEVVLG